MRLRTAALAAAGCVLLFAAAQLFQPSSLRRAQPAAPGRELLSQPALPPGVRTVLQRSCADCHDASARLPWYGHVSPVSWYLDRHIRKARRKLDFADWPRNDYDLRQNIADALEDGSMPPGSYLWLHPDAKLSEAEKKTVEAWTDAK